MNLHRGTLNIDPQTLSPHGRDRAVSNEGVSVSDSSWVRVVGLEGLVYRAHRKGLGLRA